MPEQRRAVEDIRGRIVGEPYTGFSKEGVAYTNLRVGVNAYRQGPKGPVIDREKSKVVSITVFREVAEQAGDKLHIGHPATFVGVMQGENQTWTDKNTGEMRSMEQYIASNIEVGLEVVESLTPSRAMERRGGLNGPDAPRFAQPEPAIGMGISF